MPPLANVIEDAFSPLITLFEHIMVFIHDHLVGGSWGLAIVGLTVLIRAVLVPLTFRQLKSMQEMQRLAPQINALKEKYKDDKQRQQQELMKFYQENKINPLGLLPAAAAAAARCSSRCSTCCGRTSRSTSAANELVQYFNRHPAECGEVPRGPDVELASPTCPRSSSNRRPARQVAPGSAKFLFIPDITNKATGVALSC